MTLPFRLAIRYLFARKSHNVINIISGISVAGMAVGTAALIIVLSVFNGFNSLVDKSLSGSDPDLMVVPSRGKTFLPDSAAFAWLYDLEEVSSINQILEDQVFVDYDGNQAVARVRGLDELAQEESPIAGHLLSGSFTFHEGGRPAAVVGVSLAHSIGMNIRFHEPLQMWYPDRNSTFSPSDPASSLNHVRLVPAGTFSVDSDSDASLVLVPIEAAREVLGVPDEVSAVEVRLRPEAGPRAVKKVEKGLSERLGEGFSVMDRYRQRDSVYKMMRYEKLAIFLILVFIIVIVALNVYSSMTMLMIEKREDMSTLRSMGASDSLIRKTFRLEGWMVSLLGMVIGVAIGLAAILIQQKFGIVRMSGNFIIDAYPVVLRWGDVILSALTVSVIGYLVALVPSSRA